MGTIIDVFGREILDSRGNPTVEATVMLTDGTVGVASVPSGASTGSFEAHELRDGDAGRYGGRGVREAAGHICDIISPALSGMFACEQAEVDRALCRLDGTSDKSKLGANAILAVSLAAARPAKRTTISPLPRCASRRSIELTPRTRYVNRIRTLKSRRFTPMILASPART